MIIITDKTQCCGCQACANACPKHCISMRADEEGFLYPQVDKTSCINCGLCKKVCPILNKPQTFPVLETYGATHKSSEVKMKSSSGGMFSTLAEVILKENGVVFGAAFDKHWNVGHRYADNLADLDRLRRSKYVQSDIGKTYQQAKEFLEQGRRVLFTGTPCQIAGLRSYLGKAYENLLTAELFCHGVNSPAVWQKFLAENTQKEKISSIDFRNKRFGWDVSFLKISYADGSSRPAVPVYLKFLEGVHQGILLRKVYKWRFGVSNLYERPSCHACRFKGLNGQLADFTLGDLWGEWPGIITPQDKKEGMSVLLVNTEKGRAYFKKISSGLVYQPVDLQKVVQNNAALYQSTTAHPKRAEFFARYRSEDFNKLVRELLNIKPFPLQAVRALARKIGLKF